MLDTGFLMLDSRYWILDAGISLAKSRPNPGGFGPDELSGGYHLLIGKDLVPMSYQEDITFSSGMLERYVIPTGHPFFLRGPLARNRLSLWDKLPARPHR
jgi:hypothetical protein